jgi:hypothetical protein
MLKWGSLIVQMPQQLITTDKKGNEKKKNILTPTGNLAKSNKITGIKFVVSGPETFKAIKVNKGVFEFLDQKHLKR